MTWEDIREALKWPLLAAVIVALWIGVLAVRESRAGIPGEPRARVIQEQQAPLHGIRLVWIIVLYEARNKTKRGTKTSLASPSLCLPHIGSVRWKPTEPRKNSGPG